MPETNIVHVGCRNPMNQKRTSALVGKMEQIHTRVTIKKKKKKELVNGQGKFAL